MLRILQVLFAGIILDFFFFPTSFLILPSINTKMMLAGLAIPWLAYHVIRTRSYELPKDVLYCFFFAVLYSIANLIAVELNETYDYSYANYITSYGTWQLAAFTVIMTLKAVHGKVTIRLLTTYLAVISVFQCIMALLIDRYEVVELLVNSIFFQPTEFYTEINRLYGVGAALDNGGMRFGIVLLMISFVLCLDQKIKQRSWSVLGFIIAYVIITILGNMISRSASVGALMGLAVLLLSTGIYRLVITPSNLKIFNVLLIVLVIGIPLVIYLYNTDEFTHDQLRFAFEGFFNWVEKGEWKTDSTDKLQNTMWVWPEDMRTWMIGTGYYNGYLYNTDIGYCRLILYSGVFSFSIFALMFVYCGFTFMRVYPKYMYMFLALVSLTFIYWMKTSTDIFFIYALLFCFRDPELVAPQYQHQALAQG